MTRDTEFGTRGGLLGVLALAAAVAALAAPPLRGESMTAIAPGALEGRPSLADRSPLQARVDTAAPGTTVEVGPGDYLGDLVVDKPLRLVGRGRPRLLGSGHGSVVRVRAADVTVEGFSIDGRRGGDLARDSSGVHTSAPHTTLRDLEIRDALFGIYLRRANDATVERCRVRGIPGRDPGEKGSGIHAYDLERFTIDDNEVVDVRDGLYLQNASKGTLRRNVARDVRYGLHYMFSDDNVFEDNTFENGAAGTAIMYSRRIVFRRNRFVHNRGFASVGLLFQTCEDVLAEDNLVADNARGVFIEGSHRIIVRRNVIAGSDVAVVLYDPDGGHRFEGNSFVGNRSPLDLVARHTDTVFAGNYWSTSTRAGPRRRRPRRPPLPPDERLRSPPGQHDRRRPPRPTASPPPRSVPPRVPSPSCGSCRSRTRPRSRAPRTCPTFRPGPRDARRASPAGVTASLLLAGAGGLVLARGRRLSARRAAATPRGRGTR